MSRINGFLLLLCGVVSQLFVGCDTLEQVPEGEAFVILDVYELNVTGGGGDVPIFYAVENPRRGVRPKVEPNQEWITVKEITSSMIMLAIAPSDVSEERFGFVTISYEGMTKSIKVPVLQDEQELNYFSFEVSDVTSTSCTVKYIPKESGKMYMANIIDSAYFTQSGITDMDQFIAAEMANYMALAAQYEITLQYLLEEAASPRPVFKRETTRSFSGMKAGGTYVAYAYGIELCDNEYTVTVPMHQTTITLPMNAMYDITFKVSSQMTNSGDANIAVSPVNWNGYYSVNIIPDSSVFYIPVGENINEYTLRAIGDDFYKRARQAMQGGISVDAFLKSNCYVGSHTFNLAVSGGSRYMVAVFAVESVEGGIPTMCSVPTISYL
ncbi:MAG: BACON domain-containing protein [Alistipes sp.]|nr:BACON domain-containing protein [Alistipes sp.]